MLRARYVLLCLLFLTTTFAIIWQTKSITEKVAITTDAPIFLRKIVVKNSCQKSWLDCEAAVRFLIKPSDTKGAWDEVIVSLRKQYHQDFSWGGLLVCARTQVELGVDNTWNVGCRKFTEDAAVISLEELNNRPVD